MSSYNHKSIEKKWREEWERQEIYTTKDSVPNKENFYLLVEFPYPSGNLHIGHWYAWSVPDIFARFKRMKGFNVLFPVGFDSFGLPAENAAIKRNIDPKEWTYSNIETMTTQLKSIGASFDWSREIHTSDPEYYKWTQYIFTKLYEKGLAYRAEAPVEWCPSCQTVLAHEQVIGDACERCHTAVEKKVMKQWMLRITDYADRLIDDLDELPWPDPIKEAQKNWIGRSEGAELDFKIKESDKAITVFTTRPDTLYGVTYVVLAPENKLVDELKDKITNWSEVEAYRALTSAKSEIDRQREDKEKTGVRLQNIEVLHPATGEPLPVFIADYVLGSYGTGAVMAVPAHDERDFEFAKKVVIPSNKKYLIFDFDGVLGDTWEATVESFLEVEDSPITKGKDLESIDAELKEYFRNRPFHGKDTALTPEQIQNLRSWSLKFGAILHGKGVKLFNDFICEVAKLENIQMAVVSSGSEVYVKPAVSQCGFEITHVLAHEDHHSKEEKIETICRDWGVKASDVYYFTDTKTDVYELENYLDRSKIIGCAWGFLGKDELLEVLPREQVLENFEDIHSVVEHMNVIRQVIAPHLIDKDNPPKEEKKAVFRKGVMALVRNPETNEILTLKWKRHNWHALIVGGVEEGENEIDAAQREVYEETGYKSLTYIKQFPWKIRTDYFAEHKDINRESLVDIICFDLFNDERDEVSPEENAKHSFEWIPFENLAKLSPMAEKELVLEWLEKGEIAYPGEGLLINSSLFNGLESADARTKITEKYGRKKTTYRLRDWSIGRQRYWGCPIPMVYDPDGNPHPVPFKHLPWVLPEDVDHTPTGEPPLARSETLKKRTEEIFGEGWRSEVETMDTFVDSSWYFLRYLDPKNEKELLSEEKRDAWMPVDVYSGGAEHTTLHVLYSRFFYKVLSDLGITKGKEPYTYRFNRSLILGPDGQKMSKSKGNVVDPGEQVDRVGADTVRSYFAFMGPYNVVTNYPYDLGGIAGIRRFLERVWDLKDKVEEGIESPLGLDKTVKRVEEGVGAYKFNTAISALMEFVNEVKNEKKINKSLYENFLKLLAPFAPYLTEEIWHSLGNSGSIHTESWPTYDPLKTEDDEKEVGIQVNGKLRGTLMLRKGISEEEAKAKALALPEVDKWIRESEILRVIYIEGRIINIVARGGVGVD